MIYSAKIVAQRINVEIAMLRVRHLSNIEVDLEVMDAISPPMNHSMRQ